MGSLTLPSSGSVYVDANTIIYSVEHIEPYYSLLRPLWRGVSAKSYRIVTSELALLEVLVKPIKTGNTRLENGFRRLLEHSPDIDLIPISRPILRQATVVRATTGLKTPDAVHAATALEQVASVFITNDLIFRRVAGLPLGRV